MKLFVDLARSGSLSATARRLGVDHSTVGRRIGQFERSLGLKLFHRMAKGYELTTEGRSILERAERVEEGILAFARAAQASDPAIAGPVTVSAPPVLASHFLASRLAGLRAAHPRIRLELVGQAHAARLDQREADIAIRMGRPEGDALVVRRVGRIGFGLYASPSYRDTHPDPASWDFAGFDRSLEHVPQQRWLRRLMGARDLVLCSNDLSALCAFARDGLAVCLLPHFMAAGDPCLVRLPAPDPEPTREIWLAIHADMRRSPRVQAVAGHLSSVISAGRALLEKGEPGS